MKIKSKFLLATAILCLSSVVSTAKVQSEFLIKTVQENSFVLQMANVQKAHIQVTLKDEQGVTLYNEEIMQKSYQREYDLRELPWGNYTLVVAYDSFIKLQPIRKVNEMLEIKADDLRTIFQPAIEQHDQFIDLNALCLSNLKISMEIIDNEGNVLYDEFIRPKGTLQRRFDLSQLAEGQYIFEVEIGDAFYKKEFKEYIDWSPSISSLEKF